jgi:hypothetical protein
LEKVTRSFKQQANDLETLGFDVLARAKGALPKLFRLCFVPPARRSVRKSRATQRESEHRFHPACL